MFFIIGISMFPIGLIFLIQGKPAGVSFFATGIIFFLIGIANRDKWQKTDPLRPEQKKWILVLTTVIAVVMLLLLLIYVIIRII